jgi:hypothetical protein
LEHRPDRKLLTLIVIGGGLLGLTLFARQIARQDRVSVAPNITGGGIIVRSEVLRLWLPRALIDMAKRQSLPLRIRTHHELRQSLEGQHQRGVWYALTSRVHKFNGEFDDITTIRWPYRDSRYFSELLDVLAVAGGNPASEPNSGFSNVSISVLPEELLMREPRDAMHEALETGLK